MNCILCGTEMAVSHERRRYDIGLDEPIIVEDAEVARCSECGEELVGVKHAEALHRKVATIVASKRARLTPREIRYLRTHLGYSSVDFAHAIGTEPETVSRWERVDKPQRMGMVAERLLRVLVFTQQPRDRYPLELLGIQEPEPLSIRMLPLHDHWVSADSEEQQDALAWSSSAPAGYEAAVPRAVESTPVRAVRILPGPIHPTIPDLAA